MSTKLLIFEKVQEFLGSGGKIAASVGHVRDLSVKKMGVIAPDFKPQCFPQQLGGILC